MPSTGDDIRNPVAIHIRRGDWQKFEVVNAEESGQPSQVEAVHAVYRAADEDVQDWWWVGLA